MKMSAAIRRFRFYVWVGLSFLLLWLFSELIKNPETFSARAFNNTWRVCYVIVMNFILFEFTIPFIRRKRGSIFFNILWAIPLLFVHMMLYSWGLYAWRLAGIAAHFYTALTTYPTGKHAAAEQMSYSVMSIFYFGLIKHISDYRKLISSAQLLRIEKQQAELNYLKSQTNPHFLFNTLNNIYSLARDKSDLAPQSILRLSKILRFMLYETSGEYISIEQELTIVNDYIALEKLRYDESLHVNFNYDVEDLKQAVPPLLVIPLVENAFKHGVSETRLRPFIDIHLSVKGKQLFLQVKNSAESSSDQELKENIGLSNVRRQLELLYKDFSLVIQQEEALFTASLKINLASRLKI